MIYPFEKQFVQEADGESYWVVRSKSLNGCIGVGDTLKQAIKELEKNETVWIATATELEIPVTPAGVPFENVWDSLFA